MKVTKAQANHIVGRISGVKETDTRVQAAEKAIETMKLAGFGSSAIRKAERILAEIKQQGRSE